VCIFVKVCKFFVENFVLKIWCSNSKENSAEQRKPRLMWPKTRGKEWERLDVDLVQILEGLRGSPLYKMDSYSELVYKFCRERFGEEKKEAKQRGFSSRRQKKCGNLRQQLNELKKEYGDAGEEEKIKINEQQKALRKSLKAERIAENMGKQRKKRQKNFSQFVKNPYGEAKKLIKDPIEGRLEDSKEDVEKFLMEMR